MGHWNASRFFSLFPFSFPFPPPSFFLITSTSLIFISFSERSHLPLTTGHTSCCVEVQHPEPKEEMC